MANSNLVSDVTLGGLLGEFSPSERDYSAVQVFTSERARAFFDAPRDDRGAAMTDALRWVILQAQLCAYPALIVRERWVNQLFFQQVPRALIAGDYSTVRRASLMCSSYCDPVKASRYIAQINKGVGVVPTLGSFYLDLIDWFIAESQEPDERLLDELDLIYNRVTKKIPSLVDLKFGTAAAVTAAELLSPKKSWLRLW